MYHQSPYGYDESKRHHSDDHSQSPQSQSPNSPIDRPKISELVATMGPHDNPIPDLESYTLQMNRMLDWTLSSLNRTQFDLLEVCFVVCLELYVKLFQVSPSNARKFIKTFSAPFMERYENYLRDLATYSSPSQLSESPLLRMNNPLDKHAIVITKRAKRSLICWLANTESVLIQNILQETVDFIDASALYDSSNSLVRAQVAQIYGVSIDWLNSHFEHDGRPFTGLVERRPINDRLIMGSKSTQIPPGVLQNILPSQVQNVQQGVLPGVQQTSPSRLSNNMPSGVPDEFSASVDLLVDSVDVPMRRDERIHWGLPLALYGIESPQAKGCLIIGKENTKLEDAVDLCPLPTPGTDIYSVYRGLIIAQAQNRANVNSKELPYVLSYTLYDSQDLSCASISSHGGRYIAAGFRDSTIRLWDLAASEICRAAEQVGAELGKDVGDHLRTKYLGSPEGNTRESNISFGHDGPVTSLCFGEMGTVLLSGGLDGEIRLYLPLGASTRVVYKGGGTSVFDLAYSPLGYYFASAEQDGAARLWATDRSFPLRVLRAAPGSTSVNFHPNSSILATGCEDGALRLWDIRAAKCQRIFSPPRRCFDGLQKTALSWNGRFAASTGIDPSGGASVLVWDIATGRMIDELFGHDEQIRSLSFSHGCNLLAVASDDGILSLWDTSRACGGNGPLIQKHNKTSRNGIARLAKAFGTRNCSVRDAVFTPENVLLTCLVNV